MMDIIMDTPNRWNQIDSHFLGRIFTDRIYRT